MAVVEIKQGLLQGVECEYDGYKYQAFKGIPYALPPIGQLRFKAPEPPISWEGVRDASQHGPVCPQYNERLDCIEPGNEDCLYLNVFTKSLSPGQPLPVMVWIHGGGFYTGSGNSDFYGPEFFMAHEMVLVTFNYRLESFGFLSLGTNEAPGNAGMKDQVMAIRWVKDNIGSFGGDENNITLFGCSAGAASVSFHMVSDSSKGLFHKAICQSGVCLNEWSHCIYPRERAYQIGKILGVSTDDDKVLLEKLKTSSADLLVNLKLPLVYSEKFDIADTLQFAPVIEKADPNNESFITEFPVESVKAGKVAKIPLMLGYTSAEGIEIAKNLSKMVGFMNLPGAVVPRELKLDLSSKELETVDEEIRKFYFGNIPISEDNILDDVIFETFRMFAYNIVRFARYHAKMTEKPVFLYKFIAQTDRNYGKKAYKMDDIKGVCHADDLFYLFNVTNPNIPLSEESKQKIKQVVQLWFNFAATGDPTSTGFEEQWKSFSETQRNIYLIGDELKCAENEDQEHFSFWENIYKETEL